MFSSPLDQNLLPGYPPRFTTQRVSGEYADRAVRFIQSLDPEVLGLGLQLSDDGGVTSVAFATSSHVMVVTFDSCGLNPGRSNRRNADLEKLLLGEVAPLAGFDFHHLVLQIYRSLGYHTKGVDLSTLLSPSTFEPWSPSQVIHNRITSNVKSRAVEALWSSSGFQTLCKRAWLSAVAAEACISDVKTCFKVNTQVLTEPEVKCLATLMLNVELLDRTKPTRRENDFCDISRDGDNLIIQNSRFKTRVRNSAQTEVVFETRDGKKVVGKPVGVQGKVTRISMPQGMPHGPISRVHVVGREELTNAERAREEFVLRCLRGEIELGSSAFTQILWFPEEQMLPNSGQCNVVRELDLPQFTLNSSQLEVAQTMISDSCPIVIAHGPPGTGKTTTISAAVKNWSQNDEYVWVIAQSNVGVKNIAESLYKHGVEFKIIVSKEFYVEWHEHLYEIFESSLIRSDVLFADPSLAARALGDSQVILSTIAMLSNPGLDVCNVFGLVPMTNLVIDEASQIDTFEFMHLFSKFSDSLKKVCFFGDPKQLPPYGKESAPNLKSIFEIAHLNKSAHFLDIQYRMPVAIGDFISAQVYGGKLRSCHRDASFDCLTFIDVKKGDERQEGSSWVNMEEVHTIVNLVRNYYQHKKFCIITPYDAQRNAIARQLEAEQLPWEAVFNVDAFQGHEAPFVIISAVRTSRAGFLTSINRMNVMLTRCKEGMVIVTNRAFLCSSEGSRILLGKLMWHWVERVGGQAWQDSLGISNKTAKLPGFYKSPPPAPPRLMGKTVARARTAPAAPRPIFPMPPQSSTSTQELQGSWRNHSAAIKSAGEPQPRNALDLTPIQTLLSQMRLSNSSQLSSPSSASPKTPQDEDFPTLEIDDTPRWRIGKKQPSVWASKR